MAEEGKILKRDNRKYVLAPYVGVNVIAFVIVVVGTEDVWALSEAILSSAVGSVVLGIVTLILEGQLSANTKAKLVFWRVQHPLPGCEAFSRYMYIDPRINPKLLEEKFARFPEKPNEQNDLWYSIYEPYRSEPSVADAHGSYLATRDIATLSVLFLITFGPVSFFLADCWLLWILYVGAIAVIYLLASQAAKTYGVRLVTNVLALESARNA